ncbi:serine hydrolase [Mammaliicoccus sciuri]|uniref:serine hydrolase n=1 Tax=Mammaliicoccus sciuri TaxID=1296 RepID=UPI003F5730AA
MIVETSVASPSIDNYYKILGGKTGTVGFIKNLTAIIYTNNEIFVATIMRGSSDRFNDSKIAIDEAIKKDSNENYDVTKIGDANSSFSIIKYPKVNPVLLTNFRPEILLSKNETLKQNPASMMKVVTAIVMLENMENINNTITFNESDFVGESGVKLKVGDKITMRDALYTMLLSSSNDTAKAVARTIGHTINYNRMKNIIS